MGLRSKLKNKAKNFLRMLIDRYVAEDIPAPAPPPPQKKETPPVSPPPKEPKEPSQEDSLVTDIPKESPKEEPSTNEEPPKQESVEDPVQEEGEIAQEELIEDSAKDEQSVVMEESPEKEPIQLKEHEVHPTLAPQSEEEKKAQATAKHVNKTKKGLLKKLKESSGQMSLRDLHDYSEKRFFMGHQKFSLLMEELVEEDLVEYSYEEGMVSLGDQAEAFLRT